MPFHGITHQYHYRPQRRCGQGNIFTPVCHSVHGGVSSRDTPGRENPHWETPLARRRTPPGRTPPLGRPPSKETPWQREPPPSRENPPRRLPLGKENPPPPGKENPPTAIRSMSGRYASYASYLYNNIRKYTYFRAIDKNRTQYYYHSVTGCSEML